MKIVLVTLVLGVVSRMDGTFPRVSVTGGAISDTVGLGKGTLIEVRGKGLRGATVETTGEDWIGFIDMTVLGESVTIV
jgi:hypothetical protein